LKKDPSTTMAASIYIPSTNSSSLCAYYWVASYKYRCIQLNRPWLNIITSVAGGRYYKKISAWFSTIHD